MELSLTRRAKEAYVVADTLKRGPFHSRETFLASLENLKREVTSWTDNQIDSFIAGDNPWRLDNYTHAQWSLDRVDLERCRVRPYNGRTGVGRRWRHISCCHYLPTSPFGMIPPIYNRSYSISADLDNPGRSGLGLRPGIAGVIVAEASFLGGFSLYVENAHLKHTYSLLGLKLDTISSRDELPKGKVNVRYEFTADKPGEFGTGGTSRLFINGKRQAEAKMEHTVPFRFASYAGMDIGTDNGLPVVLAFIYAKALPKYFKGTIGKVEFDLGPSKAATEDLKRIYLQRVASALCN